MWKKWVTVSLLLALLVSGAGAEGKDIVLNMPESLTEMEENGCERVCMSPDGATRIEILTLEASEDKKCGEVYLEDLCELRTNCPESFEIAVLSEEPFEGCPAKRVAYTYDVGDGIAQKAQAMAVWTEDATFIVFVLGEDEAFADAVFAALTLRAAEGRHIVPTAPEGLTDMEEIDGEWACASEDGSMRVEVLAIEASGDGMCGEGSLEELCELRTNCPESFAIAVLSEEPFEGCPAKRVAYTYDEGDGVAQKAQAMAVWAEDATHVVFVLGEDEAFADAVFAALAFSED